MICFGDDFINRPMVIKNAKILHHQNLAHVYFVNIACTFIIDDNVYTEKSGLQILFLSEKLTFCKCLVSIPWCVCNSFLLFISI